jgi:pantetheine-phosphate adenylyltransferase
MTEQSAKQKRLVGVYAGTFDPITNGHLDLVVRALGVVDYLYVAVAESTSKTVAFSAAKRIEMASASLGVLSAEERKRVEVTSFAGLLVEYVRAVNATLIIRGLRAVSDYEYEAQMAHINRHLDGEVETVFLVTSKNCSFISSSIVKNIAANGGNVEQLVPKAAAEGLRLLYSKTK